MKEHIVYTIEEVADLLKVDVQSVRGYIRQGKIRAVKFSSHTIRIPFTEISYLLKHGGDQ